MGLSVDSGLLFSNAPVTATKIRDLSFFLNCGLICNAGKLSRAPPQILLLVTRSQVGRKKLSACAFRVCQEKRTLFWSSDEVAWKRLLGNWTRLRLQVDSTTRGSVKRSVLVLGSSSLESKKRKSRKKGKSSAEY